jgi:hypothetical protein
MGSFLTWQHVSISHIIWGKGISKAWFGHTQHMVNLHSRIRTKSSSLYSCIFGRHTLHASNIRQGPAYTSRLFPFFFVTASGAYDRNIKFEYTETDRHDILFIICTFGEDGIYAHCRKKFVRISWPNLTGLNVSWSVAFFCWLHASLCTRR